MRVEIFFSIPLQGYYKKSDLCMDSCLCWIKTTHMQSNFSKESFSAKHQSKRSLSAKQPIVTLFIKLIVLNVYPFCFLTFMAAIIYKIKDFFFYLEFCQHFYTSYEFFQLEFGFHLHRTVNNSYFNHRDQLRNMSVASELMTRIRQT